MLIDPEERHVVSSLGWIDHGGLWCLNVALDSYQTILLGNASYLSLHEGRDSHFSVVHHFDSERLEVTAHNFSDPSRVLSRAVVHGASRSVEGDRNVWGSVSRYYVAYLKQPTWSDFALIQIETEGTISLQTFEWYGDHYDKGYQGILGVAEVPNSHLLIISVQRDSHPVLYDPTARSKVGQLTLAGRSGNPRLYFRRRAAELWSDDYDTILKMDTKTWRQLASAKLQGTGFKNTMQFVGQFAFDRDETICGVARPFSGDVVGVDPDSMKLRCRADLGQQPLEAAILSNGRVFSRDWKSGAFLSGELRAAT